MRILQLCPKAPWPPDDGGRIASRVLALSLARAGARVRVLSLNPVKHRADPARLPGEALSVGLELVGHDTSPGAAGFLLSLARGGSYNVDRFRSPAFARRLVEVVREESPDVVLLDSLYMVPYVALLRRSTRARVVLRSLNLEHEIWERLARGERGPRRLVLAHLARRLRRFEISTLNDADAIVPVTPEDAGGYRRLGATVPIHVAPVGVEAAAFPERPGGFEPRTLVYLGALDWRPNLEATRWFLERVWPLVRGSVPDARFLLGGSNPPAGLEARVTAAGVRLLGRVPDARAFLSSAAAMVVPLLSGGGMRVKILEAMALGVPVVSTRLGAAGIEARDGEEILLAESPEELAAACVSLLTDPDRAAALGRAGRLGVLERFDADAIAGDLLEFLSGLVAPDATRL